MPYPQHEDNAEGKDDATSVSVAHDQNKLYLALAMDYQIDGKDATRVTGQCTIGDLAVGAIYNISEASEGNSNSSKSTLIGSAYKIENFTLEA